jgi:hypothetical protein
VHSSPLNFLAAHAGGVGNELRELRATHDQESAFRGDHQQLGKQLRRLASHVKPAKLRKHPRGPKKKVKKGYAPRQEVDRHVSTARVLRGDENT